MYVHLTMIFEIEFSKQYSCLAFYCFFYDASCFAVNLQSIYALFRVLSGPDSNRSMGIYIYWSSSSLPAITSYPIMKDC